MMTGSHVVLVSCIAALSLFVVFFASWYGLRRLEVPRLGVAWIAPLLAGVAWFAVVELASAMGWVRSEEALFHHIYVLLVVGMPLVGVVLGGILLVGPDQLRRPPVRSWVTVVVFVAPAVVGVWATHVEPGWLRVDRVALVAGSTASAQSAATRETIRIGVIADIQTDSFGDYERRAIALLMQQEPDVIFVAGDLTQVDSEIYENIRASGVETMSELSAPGGVFVIDGNTDIGGAAGVAEFARDAGLTPLNDEVIEISVNGRRARIGGLSWPNNNRVEAAHFVRTFASSATDLTVDVLLAHSPDAILNVADGSAIDLVVSGHTHGGQIALPLVGPLWNVTELSGDVAGGGLHEVLGAPVYVSTGVGVQRGESPKIRFGVRPSVGVIDVQ